MNLQVKEWTQRALHAEQLLSIKDDEVLRGMIVQHLKERTALKAASLQAILEATLFALTNIADSPTTENVNKIVSALQVTVGASKL